MMDTLRLSGITTGSMVDGPGMRITIFTQGCPHKCPGCHNPQTWNNSGGYESSIAEIGEQILAASWCTRLTLSGGEPMIQAEALNTLIGYIKNRTDKEYHIMVYTGYTWEYLTKHGTDEQKLLLCNSNLVVDGPFMTDIKSLELNFRGSRNQRIIESQQSLLLGEVVLSSYNN